jgi:hypothetical protein
VIRGYHAEIDLNALNRGVQAPIAVQVRPLRASEVLGLEVDLLFFDTTSTYFVTEEAERVARKSWTARRFSLESWLAGNGARSGRRPWPWRAGLRSAGM